MEDIRTVENQMHQDMDNLIGLVDQFESALNTRTREWYNREVKAKKMARARNRMISWIITAVIAVVAVVVAFSVLKI